MNIVIFGLSITSSWGNGHATTYRALLRGLALRGHHLLFLERDQPWYAAHRDLVDPPYCRVAIYRSLEEVQRLYGDVVQCADAVIVGSYIPDGRRLGEWVARRAEGITAFYDIDTPVTLRALEEGRCGYLSAAQVAKYHLYLSFTGGPLLEQIARQYGAARVHPLYCAVDADVYRPQDAIPRWDLGYLGTYAADRQPSLDELLVEPAKAMPGMRFVVAGAQYPGEIAWPRNVDHIEHLAPPRHRGFYAGLRYALNITRADMVRAGWSPSVRLFEAAACGAPVISDAWPGLEHFFTPGREILVARTRDQVREILADYPEPARRALARQARARVLAAHTARCRARELEGLIAGCAEGRPPAGGGERRDDAVESGVAR